MHLENSITGIRYSENDFRTCSSTKKSQNIAFFDEKYENFSPEMCGTLKLGISVDVITDNTFVVLGDSRTFLDSKKYT